MAAVIVVLHVYDDRPLSEWPHRVSLNAVISTLALVSKACLLAVTASCISQLKWTRLTNHRRPLIELEQFDAASRGVRGSLRMIVTPALWHIALVGAVVTVAAIAIGPFTQQAITYPLRTVAVSTAIVPRTQTYQNAAPGGLLGIRDVPLTMKAAAYSGLFDPGAAATRASTTAQCSTGNCTFSEYTSLAVCSRCVNVTRLVARNGCSGSGSSTQCRSYTLPNQLLLDGDGGLINTTANTMPNQVVVENLGASLINLSIILSQANFSTTPDDIRAYDCSIYFCLQKYQTSFQNGVFKENVSDEYISDVPRENSTVGYNIAAPPAFVAPNEQTNFAVSDFSYQAVGSYLRKLLVGDAFAILAEASYSSDAMDALYNSLSSDGSGTSIIDALARSMTAEIRSSPGANIAWALGASTQDSTYIHVRWAWLALPLALQALALLLLGMTMISSFRSRTPIWKSSLLAALFLAPSGSVSGGPEPQQGVSALNSDGNVSSNVCTLKEMEAKAKEMRVRLLRDEGGGLRLQ
ncbi:hypothetical protein G647_08645 [Cladophialophora carrionii CBS 160.54]|uniref:Uncharacterized protein n=1 Tax=Cladophialophora carrionii CBS 160.54 TaxID=1279043 RepID=V9D3L5_9EURO|nr:uncharacterized protein G647_08645 [Cladophialophora carrionii CBS 160.54]ETI20607.1 hypothetical protein G647_08645 [Cladophialophora carrionii CBS 160.54]